MKITREEAARINAIEDDDERLAAVGIVRTSVEEFLGLTSEEVALIDMRITLSNALRERRAAARLTQAEVAERIGSSQPRIAKAEAGHRNVSFDLLLRAMVATGATNSDIGKALAATKPIKPMVRIQKPKVA